MRARGNRRSRAATVTLAAVAASLGCAVGPDYVEPEIPAPDAWQQQLTRGLAEGEADLQTWWTVFEDPTLTSLVDRSVEQNLGLQLAFERIAEARPAWERLIYSGFPPAEYTSGVPEGGWRGFRDRGFPGKSGGSPGEAGQAEGGEVPRGPTKID